MLEYSPPTDFFVLFHFVLFIWTVLQQELQGENYRKTPYQ